MYKFGDVILARIQFVDTYEIKQRPALILFEEYENIVVAGITSNTKMRGIKIDELPKPSIIKLNYIFTISKRMVVKKITQLPDVQKNEIKRVFIEKLR